MHSSRMCTARSLTVSCHMPPGNHACPPATMHAPHNHACPLQPHMPPGNNACPPATTHTPLPTTHAPLATTHAPCNHACPPTTTHAPPLWTEWLTDTCKNNLRKLRLRAVIMVYSHWPEPGWGTNGLYEIVWTLPHYTWTRTWAETCLPCSGPGSAQCEKTATYLGKHCTQCVLC